MSVVQMVNVVVGDLMNLIFFDKMTKEKKCATNILEQVGP
jgi:hypothetical protein